MDRESLEKITANKFRIGLIDTHGKEYKSKWYRTKEFNLKDKSNEQKWQNDNNWYSAIVYLVTVALNTNQIFIKSHTWNYS